MELDSDLNFKGHHKTSNKSLSYKSYLLSRYRTRLTLDAALDTVKTMVLPVVDYGQLLYGSGNKAGLVKIQGAIDRMLKICYFMYKDESSEEIRTRAKVKSLDDRRELALAIASFNYAQAPEHTDNRDIRTRTHDARLVVAKYYKLSLARHSVTYRMAHKWNSLTAEIRNSTSLEVFKTKVT